MSRASILSQAGGAFAIGLLALSALPTHAAAEAEQCDVPFRHDTIRMIPESFDRNIAKITDHGFSHSRLFQYRIQP